MPRKRWKFAVLFKGHKIDSKDMLKNALFFSRNVLFITLFFLASNLNGQDETELLQIESGEVDTIDITARSVRSTEKDVMDRISALSGCMPMVYNSVVRSYINTYVYRKRQKTEAMLGKRLLYFTLFERALKENGMPHDLKYLSVVESALNPSIVSSAGATGLWQFMPETGSEYGLKINSTVDERSNPAKATEAAMRYLKRLYDQYGDWALALAAYNSGPTRVNNAIKRSHSRNFWKLQRYLPKETANYVPAFIAASYICTFFTLHGIEPEYPELDKQLTTFMKVFDSMSFRDIADATGLEYSVVKELNPGFKKDYIPGSTEGHFVCIPNRVLPSFLKYLNRLSGRNYTAEIAQDNYIPDDLPENAKYYLTSYRSEKGEWLDDLAAVFGCSSAHLKAWNNLESNYLNQNTTIKIWHPVTVLERNKIQLSAPPKSKPNSGNSNAPHTAPKPAGEMPITVDPKVGNAPVKTTPAAPQVAQAPAADPTANVKYVWHVVKKKESLHDIAKEHQVTVDDIKKLNSFKTLTVGMKLKIKPE